jgi:S1-C subfamily serine protease
MRVLVLPQNGSSEQVVECLLGWSRSGLLEPFAWCYAKAGEVPAVETRVSKVESGEVRELLLGAALQDGGDSKDELIAFYPATPDEGFDGAFTQAALAHVDLLARAIAHDTTRPARCTMVIAPSEIEQPVPPGLLSQSFASNVYVAPEDRAEPRDPNRLLGNVAVFPMHAAHAIATVSDLWHQAGEDRESVVDLLARRQSHNRVAVQMVRCYSRAIDFGYLPDHVAAGIFYGEGGWPNPDQERFDRIEDAARIVPFVVDDYMTTYRLELGLSDFEPLRMDDPPELGLLEAFLLLVGLLIDRIRRKPKEELQKRVDSFLNRAAGWVEDQAAPESGIRVKRRGGPEGPEVDPADLEDVLEEPLVVPDGPVGEAWKGLRKLVLGLVDGADLPKGVKEARLVNGRGQRALLTEPAVLAPDPEGDPPPVAGWTGPICDPMQLDPALLQQGDSVSPSEALAEWSQPHSRSLLWKVGYRIASAILIAEAEGNAPVGAKQEKDEDEADTAPALERRRNLWRRLRRVVLSATTVAALAVAAAVHQLALPAVAVALIAVLVSWFLTLASAARRWFHADEAITREEVEESLGRWNAAMKRSLRKGDEIRLRRRYREYLDWAEMLGLLLHKPWVGDPLDHVALSPPIDPATLPAAFSVGIAEVCELSLDRLSAAAGAGVFGVGWLSGLYDKSERREMIELEIRRGLAPEDAEVERKDPAQDLTEEREGPRRRLLDAIRRGKHRSLGESELALGVLEYLSGRTPDQVCDRVAVLPTADRATVGEEIDALPPPLAGFRPPEMLDRLVAELAPAVVQIESRSKHRDFGGAGVVIDKPGLVATSLEAVQGAESISVLSVDGHRFEAELRAVDEESKLALVSFEVDDLPALDLPEEVRPVQGDPVIGIARTAAGNGSVSATWGLVAAGERKVEVIGAPAVPVLQVAYHRAEGADGAPVFGLEGELLGIQVLAAAGAARGRGSQLISNVVPVDYVRRMMEGGTEAAVAGGRPRKPPEPPRQEIMPSAFVANVTHVDPPPSLLSHHWRDAEKKNEVEETIPALEDAVSGHESLQRLAARVTFLAPLRVLVHRVDLVAPVNVTDLKSFPDTEVEEQEPEEQFNTIF